MADTAGTITVPKNSQEIRDQFLRDITLAAQDTGVEDPPITPGSDWFILAEGVSQTTMVGLANGAIGQEDTNVLTATGEPLDRIREGYGLPVVSAAGSSGKIKITVSGTTTIGSGTVLKLSNGLRFQTVGTYINPADGDEINVTAIDTGTATNAAAGAVIRFVSPPINVSTDAAVSSGSPLTGGTDVEGDERKRDRILNTLRNKPAGGNWGYIRQLVLDNFGGVRDVYIYPALGGPSSQKVVPVKEFDVANNDYSRAPSSAALQTIRGLIHANMPTGVETVVQAPTDEEVDFTVLLEIPDSALSGGNGQGWLDPTPWPSLEVADAGDVAITAVNSDNDELTLDAETATEPVDGQTRVAWWSAADRKFYSALVTAHSGAAGAWVITLDRPLVGIDGLGPQVDDYVCPDAANLGKYGDSWVSTFGDLGPGENTADSNRLPRAKRHPFASDEDPSSITNTALTRLSQNHSEITDIDFGVNATTSPTVPASVDDPPNILVPGKFAVYPI